MANPFIDDQACQDDEEYDEEASSYGDESGTGGSYGSDEEDREYDGGWTMLHQEQWMNEDDVPSDGLEFAGFVDYLEQRYVNRYNNENNSSLILLQTSDDELDTFTLHQSLLSEMCQSFWKIRCIAGEEIMLVADILQHEHERMTSSSFTTSSVSRLRSSDDLTRNTCRSPVKDAIECIHLFAQSPTLTVDAVVDNLCNILGQTSLSQQWRNAVDVAITEPDEDTTAGLSRFHALVPSLLALEADVSQAMEPVSVTAKATPANHSYSVIPPEDEYRVLSAFVAPTVAGNVYLEARLGKNPQSMVIVEFLRGHSAVVKTGHLGRGRTKRQVWIEPISVTDIAQLLSAVPPQSQLQPHTWVRVTKGTYTDDVGLVLRRESGLAQQRLVVLLVPHLPPPPAAPSPPERPAHPKHPLVRDNDTSTKQHPLPASSTEDSNPPSHKRKRTREWYPRTLFDPSTSQWRCERLDEERYQACKEEFDHGLLVGRLSYNAVSRVDITIDDITRQLFKQSNHPRLKTIHFPASSNWRFFVNNRVEVIQSAPLTISHILQPGLAQNETYLKDGIIHSVEQNRCLVQFHEYTELNAQDTEVWVNNINLRKMFRIGDAVLVVSGESEGRFGLVVTSYGDEIVIANTVNQQVDTFYVDPNVCRLTTARQQADMPWINRHVTICRGRYNQYTGVVVDVLLPQPNFTMLDVSIPRLMAIVRLQHDDVVDTCSNKTLQEAHPLDDRQTNFRQASWGLSFAPNLQSVPIDAHTNQVLRSEDSLSHQPEQPWIGVQVMVVKGPDKHQGTLKSVERNHRVPSGLRVSVELNYMSAEHGAVPVKYFEYEAALSVPNPKTLNRSLPQPGSSTPPWNDSGFFDPFQTPGAGSSSSGSLGIAHWILDPRLDGKEFFVCWKPADGDGFAKVIAKPDCIHRRVLLTHGVEKWYVPPQEIHDLALPIKPTTNKDPLVVIRGEHTGKHIRHIFYAYADGETEPRITAAVYLDWGTSNEKLVDIEGEEGESAEIQVWAEDCARAAYDLNKSRFKEQIAALRTKARTSDKGKTPRRPYQCKTRG
ncbi:hypothetical protein VKT23_009505 [Stygiomarasmius scandens]|uniref:KOW domain-containing protein n=1 Tax=Marasmiellus scandens TaxID=2682957 RepID=A0ABR1JER7_9AGAR